MHVKATPGTQIHCQWNQANNVHKCHEELMTSGEYQGGSMRETEGSVPKGSVFNFIFSVHLRQGISTFWLLVFLCAKGYQVAPGVATKLMRI